MPFGKWILSVYTRETYNLILFLLLFFHVKKLTIYNIFLFFYRHAFVQDKIILIFFFYRYKLIFLHKVLCFGHNLLK